MEKQYHYELRIYKAPDTESSSSTTKPSSPQITASAPPTESSSSSTESASHKSASASQSTDSNHATPAPSDTTRTTSQDPRMLMGAALPLGTQLQDLSEPINNPLQVQHISSLEKSKIGQVSPPTPYTNADLVNAQVITPACTLTEIRVYPPKATSLAPSAYHAYPNSDVLSKLYRLHELTHHTQPRYTSTLTLTSTPIPTDQHWTQFTLRGEWAGTPPGRPNGMPMDIEIPHALSQWNVILHALITQTARIWIERQALGNAIAWVGFSQCPENPSQSSQISKTSQTSNPSTTSALSRSMNQPPAFKQWMRMQSPSPHAPRTFRVSHSGPFNHSFQYEGWQIDLHLQCTWEIMKEAPSNKVFTPSNHPRSDIGTSPSQDPSMRPDLHVIHPQWQSNPPNYPTHVTLQTSRTEKSLRNF